MLLKWNSVDQLPGAKVTQIGASVTAFYAARCGNKAYRLAGVALGLAFTSATLCRGVDVAWWRAPAKGKDIRPQHTDLMSG
ncbi:hypothetical protein PLESHI_16402 [Plesiomonas shigelloides 302-73]|uniref:Uncharacterized protein n=1 Tax=Plesiomonas shigelloides 302-73 TaxID=1315976 RepID=R8ALS7_PLESH|nr:hypothetical protein PLESHI_16402 [Plesiomonas shigelloides 302-73]